MDTDASPRSWLRKRSNKEKVTDPPASGMSRPMAPYINNPMPTVLPRPKRRTTRTLMSAPRSALTPPVATSKPRKMGGAPIWRMTYNAYNAPIKFPNRLKILALPARERSSGFFNTRRNPSIRSDQMLFLFSSVVGGDSDMCMSPRLQAEKRNERASNKIANG